MAGEKTRIDGILFDSKFEAQVYLLLKIANIDIKDIHPEFILFEDFTYTDIDKKEHKVRNMKYTGDFLVETPVLDKPLVIEAKDGLITADYMIRKKLFLMKYSDQYYFQQVNGTKEIKALIEKIKEN